jgi:hypothetical protein
MIKGFKTYKNSLGLGYVISLVYVDGKESKSYFSTVDKATKMKDFLIAKGYVCLN